MITSVANTWRALTFTQRAMLGLIAAGVFGSILFVGQFASRQNYAVLFSNLESDDAGAVTGKLRDLKVDYRLAQGGRAIEVPEDKVYDLRLTLASDGLPRGGSTGFELFDKISFGATDFTQRLNFQRALQGELTRTINKLDGVIDTRVHLAIPEKRLFTDKDEPPTASVVLHLRPGHQLSERQVNGITHLVSSAVEGLKTENVTVHDEQGNLLSSSSTNGSPLLTDSQNQLQERYEQRMAAELQTLADRVLGPGKAGIRVSADLNWDKTDTTTETYRPSGLGGKNLPTEEQTVAESYTRAEPGLPSRGVPGFAGTSGNSAAAGNTKPGNYTSTQSGNKYAVNKVVEHKITAPGKVRRISVAVLVDGTLPVSQQVALRNAFAAGAGLDMTPTTAGGRGDRIELLSMPFDKTEEKSAAKAADTDTKQAYKAELLRNSFAAGIVALVAIATFFMMRKPKAARAQLDVIVGEDNPNGPLEIGASDTAGEVPQILPAEPIHQAVRTPMDRIRQITEDRPDEVARQLQSWITQ